MARSKQATLGEKEIHRPQLVPLEPIAQAVCVIAAGLMGLTLILLPILDYPYNTWVKWSHAIMLLGSVGCWFAIQRQMWSGERVLWIVAIGFTASNVLLLQLVGGTDNTIPSFLAIVACLVVPLRPSLIMTVCILHMANLVVAELRYDFGVPIGFIVLLVASTTAVIMLSQVTRRQRERAYQDLNTQALAAAAREKKLAATANQLREKLTQDEKLRSLGGLAGGVVHDLNNLLAPIVGASDLLLSSSSDKNQQDLIKRILRGAEQATHLTTQLKAFAGGTESHIITVDFVNEVEKIRHLTWRGLHGDLLIRTNYPEQKVFVEADPAQLHQIVANLLTNAMEALEGEIGGRIDIVVQIEGKGVILQIADTGHGIDAAVAGRMFEPFQSTKGDGRGLGLAATYGAVKRLGGNVSAQSSAEGTVMSVWLPTTTAPQPVPAVPLSDAHGLNVLIVDDEAPVREVLGKLVQSLGGKTALVSSGEAAVAEIEAGSRPTVVMMDVRMPGIGGVAAAEKIRQIVPHQPIVFCTGFAKDQLDRFESDPLTTIVSKPVTRQKLMNSIDKLITPLAEASTL